MVKTAYIGVILLSMLISQEFVVQPYLQSPTWSTIHILWETDSGSESKVEWGSWPTLGEVATGTSITSYGSNKLHTVQLKGLQTSARYYYRVITGNLTSDIYDFIMPSDPMDEASFKIVAMSDMQRDNSNPNKFEEIVHDGIITYFTDNYFGDLSLDLQMVLVPGDLVDNGLSYSQWANTFFAPAHPLFAHVPVYPVLGNHESDTDYYFDYFHLPENGTEGYEEHWWYTDYSNLRVVGIDSNPGYQLDVQLDWLEDVLDDACYKANIDFVFAQLHHPYKSELWLAGETDYTGEVISRMESFTEECGKPSIHFFGHTHGYSRGQSMDHEHLWVNVATAGGNIDYWGEYAQADYPEFTVSQDEWGFVMVEVQAGDDPGFLMKRISRGNEDQFRDNELRDAVHIRLHNEMPDTPLGIYPSGSGIDPDMIILQANSFIDADGDEIMASHFRLYANCDTLSTPIEDEFINRENWYYYENTQESVEMSILPISPLNGNSAYCWQVRYRDSSLGWSAWSEPMSFETSESQYSDNLLLNPGGESGIDSWTVTEGYMESLEAYVCDGVEPHSGDYYFILGALCNTASYSEAYQEIDLSAYMDCIDQGLAYADYGGYLSDWGGDDHPEMTIAFMDENGNEIDGAEILGTYNAFWTLLSNEIQIPVGTRSIHMILMGTRYAGDDNDSYFDDLFLKVWQDEDCMNTGILGDLNQDDMLNILDIIIMVNIILELDDYESLADMNGDGIMNILDVITLINAILEH
jgi:predicted MPP superfamily phosphohydrolase